MSEGEEQAGGRHKDAILGDACEALIAAIYRDGGFESAFAFVEKYWGPRLESVRRPPQDAKTRLQEWLQAQKLPPPRYRVVERSGPDHAPEFRVEVDLHEFAPETGVAGSKRAAEQLEAEAVLKREGVL